MMKNDLSDEIDLIDFKKLNMSQNGLELLRMTKNDLK